MVDDIQNFESRFQSYFGHQRMNNRFFLRAFLLRSMNVHGKTDVYRSVPCPVLMVKLSLKQAVEAHRDVRRRGSHIF
jgi:hypothetical protein